MGSLAAENTLTKPHYLALIRTALQMYGQPERGQGPLRILDVGCGGGGLLATLHRIPCSTSVEVFGFEIHEHGARRKEWLESVVERLSRELPGTDWKNRIAVVGKDDPWPFAQHSFDVIVSSQVLEHVHDHEKFFANVAERLSTDGLAIHVFPPRQTLVEPHVRLLGGHWVKNHRLALKLFVVLYALACIAPGLRRSKRRVQAAGGVSEAAARAKRYLLKFENTPSTAVLRRAVSGVGLHIDTGLSVFVFEEALRRSGMITYPTGTPYSFTAIRLLRPLRQLVGLFGVQVAVCSRRPITA